MYELGSMREMIQKLSEKQEILGLVEYGSAHYKDSDNISGDYDLLAITNKPLSDSVESLHFYIQHIPVDLNFRSIEYLKKQFNLYGFDSAFLYNRVIYDPKGVVFAELDRLKKTSESNRQVKPLPSHDIAGCRHGHKQVIDKVKKKADANPVLCRFLLNTDIYWLIMSFFSVRGMEYPGEKQALAYISEMETDIFNKLEQFYAAGDIEKKVKMVSDLTEMVLAPINGPLQEDEVVSFGSRKEPELQEKGRSLYNSLFL